MFKELLRNAGLNKKELAEELGLKKATVYCWGNNPPYYAEAYLKLLAKYKALIILK